jgi:hypothetical protein
MWILTNITKKSQLHEALFGIAQPCTLSLWSCVLLPINGTAQWIYVILVVKIINIIGLLLLHVCISFDAVSQMIIIISLLLIVHAIHLIMFQELYIY